MLSIYCETDNVSLTIYRIISQVKQTAPSNIQFVKAIEDADYAILTAIGIDGVKEFIDRLPCILLQLCHKTAGPQEFWDYAWSKAKLVGSYYDLKPPCPYVRFPVGFDEKVFYNNFNGAWKERPYPCAVTGRVDGPEEIRSVYDGFGVVVHLGRDFRYGPGYIHFNTLTDDEMRGVYSRSQYVAGLRHIEGFELPIIEGAACGCQPIAFDMPCYRYWFDDFATFIQPNLPVTAQLERISREKPYREIKPEHLERFKLHNAWAPFWDAFLEVV